MSGKQNPGYPANPNYGSYPVNQMNTGLPQGMPQVGIASAPQYADPMIPPQGPPPTYQQSLNHPIYPASVPAPNYGGYMQVGSPYPNALYYAPGQQYPQLVQYQQTIPNMHTAVVAPGGFDAGARFDGRSPPAIPPAPPGVAPTAAQIAAANGQTVLLGQKGSSFFGGTGGGGYTFW